MKASKIGQNIPNLNDEEGGEENEEEFEDEELELSLLFDDLELSGLWDFLGEELLESFLLPFVNFDIDVGFRFSNCF